MTSKKPSSGQRVLLLESITASGLPRTAFSPSLWLEASRMREALARDLRALIGTDLVEALTPQTPSLQEEASAGSGTAVSAHPPWAAWRSLIGSCAALLPVAPESGGELLSLTVLAAVMGTACLGSRPEAVRLAGSKRATAQLLARAGLPVVPTWRAGEADWATSPAGWVLKPDDGAGAEATHRLMGPAGGLPGALRESLRRLAEIAPAKHEGCVVQPFIEGPSGSLCLFGNAARLHLLASSTQYVHWGTEGAGLAELGVNETLIGWADAEALARRIAAALLGLEGFWGVDFILGRNGLQVLEVNPRPTSTYPALAESLGWNPAALLLGRAPTRAGAGPGCPIRLSFE